MSIIIKNMDMPKTATTLVVFPNGYVACYDVKDNFIAETRATELPPHGRLIDADKLAEEHRTMAYENGGRSYSFHITAKAWVDNSPAVIPAEVGE